MPLSPLNKTSSNPLPADEQQRIKGHAVAPAVAGKAPQNPSVVSSQTSPMLSHWQHWHCYCLLLFQLLLAFYWDVHVRTISSSLSKSVTCVSKSVMFCPRFVSMLDLTPFLWCLLFLTVSIRFLELVVRLCKLICLVLRVLLLESLTHFFYHVF